MAIQFIVTKIDDEGEFLSVFGQILFTGNYTGNGAGGDAVTTAFDKGSAGVSGTSKNTAGLSVFLSGQTSIHATRPPFGFNLQAEIGKWTVALVPGTGALNFTIKVILTSSGVEIANGAYDAVVTGSIYNYLELRLKKNI